MTKSSLRPLLDVDLTKSEIDLGKIAGVFGVKGELRLFLHFPESDLLVEPRRVILVAPDGQRFEAVLSVRSGAGKRIIGRIEHLDDCNEAERLVGYAIRIAADDLPPTEPDEFYIWQLVGLPVWLQPPIPNEPPTPIGTIRVVHSTDDSEVLEVEPSEGEPVFIPLLHQWIIEITTGAQGRVVVASGAWEEE